MTLAFLAGLLIFLSYLATRSIFRVEEGHVAVLTSFGGARRDAVGALLKYRPGLQFKRPWDKVHVVSLKEQNLDLSGEEGGRSAMTADGTILRFDSILRFVPMEDELDKFLFGLKAPLDHITGLFTCLLRNEIANFHSGEAPQSALATSPSGTQPAGNLRVFGAEVSSYSVIRRERRDLNERIEAFCKAKIGSRYGVRFAAVDLTDILPPDELADALNAVMQSQVEAVKLYARAEGECQQRVLSATRGVEIARERARAVEVEIDGLTQYLEQLSRDGTLADYVARRRAEVLSEARAHYVKGGVT